MPCLDCGVPTRGKTRCDAHAQAHRGTTAQRGYGGAHQALRRRWQRRIDTGELVLCRRCGEPVTPGDEWDLGHDDLDRTIAAEPEHARPCNRAAAGRSAHSG